MQDLQDSYRKAICYFTVKRGSDTALGMGGFISPRHVLTAKHVLEGHEIVFATNVYGEHSINKLEQKPLKIYSLAAADLAIVELDQDMAPAHFSLPAKGYDFASIRDAKILSNKGQIVGVDLPFSEPPPAPGLLTKLFTKQTPVEREFSAVADPIVRSVDFSHSYYPKPIAPNVFRNRTNMQQLEYFVSLRTSFAVKAGQSGSVIFDQNGVALSVLSCGSDQEIRRAVKDLRDKTAQAEKAGAAKPDVRAIPFWASYPGHLIELTKQAGLKGVETPV